MYHLRQIEECMTAMGGTVDAARKRIQKVKDQERNQATYWKNHEARREARNDHYHNNPEQQNQADKAAYWKNTEDRREARNIRYHNEDSEEALSNFLKSGRYGPSFPCVVCHELHWRSNVYVIKEDDFDSNFICIDYVRIERGMFMKQGDFFLCGTCKRKINSNEMPRVAAKNNLECPWDGVKKDFLELSEVHPMFFTLLYVFLMFAGGELSHRPHNNICKHPQQ